MNYFGFIYKWTDSSNGKNYIGSHKGFIEDGYIGSGTLFRRAFKKRPETFTKEILEYVYEDSKDVLLEIEQKYLNKIDWNNTYNISTIACGSDGMKGKKQSELAKQKIRLYRLGKTHSEQIKKELSKLKIGKSRKPFTKEHKQNMSNSAKGKPKSEAHRKTMSERRLGKKRGPYKLEHNQ